MSLLEAFNTIEGIIFCKGTSENTVLLKKPKDTIGKENIRNIVLERGVDQK